MQYKQTTALTPPSFSLLTSSPSSTTRQNTIKWRRPTTPTSPPSPSSPRHTAPRSLLRTSNTCCRSLIDNIFYRFNTMTTINRKLRRNVFFFDVANPGEALGGLYQGGSITNKNFFGMLEIVLVFKAPFTVTLEENIVAPSEETLLAGNYYIKSEESIKISNEIWVPRTFSFSLSGRDDDFRNDVRARDGRCVITGQVNVRPDVSWSGFHAAHVFPLQHETWFKEYDYGRWVPTPPNSRAKINAVQNGLLMASNVHTDFDNYLFSINPDDNYKIVSFMPDPWGIDGKVLQDCCRQDSDPSRVSEELLRWYYRQSVLANMRGAGEPIFEHDFPPGYDEIAEVASGPYGKQRLEMALASRFTIL